MGPILGSPSGSSPLDVGPALGGIPIFGRSSWRHHLITRLIVLGPQVRVSLTDANSPQW